MPDDRSTPIAAPLSLHELRLQFLECANNRHNDEGYREAMQHAANSLRKFLDHEHAQGARQADGAVDTYTPLLWATMSEDQRWSEYVRVRQQVEAQGQEIARLKQALEAATRETAAPDATAGTNEAAHVHDYHEYTICRICGRTEAAIDGCHHCDDADSLRNGRCWWCLEARVVLPLQGPRDER
jgi:hypothetical protein